MRVHKRVLDLYPL